MPFKLLITKHRPTKFVQWYSASAEAHEYFRTNYLNNQKLRHVPVNTMDHYPETETPYYNMNQFEAETRKDLEDYIAELDNPQSILYNRTLYDSEHDIVRTFTITEINQFTNPT